MKAKSDFRMISRLWMAISQRLGKIVSNFQKFVFSKNFNLDAGSIFRSIRAFSSLLEAHGSVGTSWSRICVPVRSKKNTAIYTPNVHVITNRIFSNWSKRRPWPDLDATQRDNRWIPVKNTVECSLARRRRRKFSFIFCVTSADVRRCDLSLFTNVSCSLVHLNSLRTSL